MRNGHIVYNAGVDPDSPGEITELLIRSSGGNRQALDALMPIVYGELHLLARSYGRREFGDHTLQPTAIVSEAYLRLVNQHRVDWRNRAHFFGIAAQINGR
jgi:ECF sigma factor